MENNILKSLKTIVDYLWEGEREDFLGTCGNKKNEHIFNHISSLNDWLQANQNALSTPKIWMIKVHQMSSPRTGKEVANQLVILTPEGKYFQSYSSIIAYINKQGKVFLDKEYWDYSATTGKYRNEFLGEKISETKKKIASKKYELISLN